MSYSKLQLHGGKQKLLQQLSPDDLEAYLSGKLSLKDAFKLSDTHISQLSRQAEAYFVSGLYQKAADIFEGLWALGEQAYTSAIALTQCYEQLDRPEDADEWAEIARTRLVQLDQALAQEK